MTSKTNNFSSEVADKLDYYVYRLIDPRNGHTFYVGKGKGNRVFTHAKTRKQNNAEDDDGKSELIKKIELDGLHVEHIIHRHGMDAKTAFEVEAALIDAYPGTLNKVKGHGDSSGRGVRHAKQIIEHYEAPQIKFKHKVLMITIRRSVMEEENIYEAVRYAWKLNAKRAERADYVLAMKEGVVVGVFKPEKWLEVTKENKAKYFRNHKGDLSGRWGFIGKTEVSKDIKEIYLNKRLPDKMRKKGIANPVRYTYK